MRERLMLFAIVAGAVFGLVWTANALYFEPMRLADTQILALASELSALQARERRARVDLARLATNSGLSVASLVDTQPDAAASAERLQEIVRNTLASSGGQPISSQSGISELGGGYTKTSLLLRVRFDEAGLLGFLRQVETMTPVLLVEALEVQQLPIPGEAKALDVTANLVGIHANVAAP